MEESTKPGSATTTSGPSGVLVVGHGTRDPQGQAEFLQTIGLIQKQLPGVCVEPCFLELAEPRIEQGVMQLARKGVRDITVMPLLLFAAGHVKRDIPEAVRYAVTLAERQFGPLAWRQVSHLGCEDRLLELSARRFQETVGSIQNQRDGETLTDRTYLLMVGRGSHDPNATDEMNQFARHRSRLTPVAECDVCYIAMAQPSLEFALANVQADVLVVQPHLLFGGELVRKIQDRVHEFVSEKAVGQVLVTKRLGPDRLLAEAIVARIQEQQQIRPVIT